MSLPSGLPTKKRALKRVSGQVGGQSGNFSPFLFGMLMGLTVFSAVSMYAAQRKMAEEQVRKMKQDREDAQEVAGAMAFSILTETQDTYNDTYNLERARTYAATTGKTRGNQDFMVTSRQKMGETFGESGQQVAIVATDDTLLREKLVNTEDTGRLAEIAAQNKQPVAVYDTSEARQRQVLASHTSMESMGEQLYAWFAGHMKFPTRSEFEALQQNLGLRDSWGRPFDYEEGADGQTATLSFTTPWNYTQTLHLSLKED